MSLSGISPQALFFAVLMALSDTLYAQTQAGYAVRRLKTALSGNTTVYRFADNSALRRERFLRVMGR